MKKALLGIVHTLILISFSLPAHAAKIQLKVDGVAITSDVEPEIKRNRIMVPLRVIIENLGIRVHWSDSIVTLTKNDIEVVLNLRNGTILKNGKVVPIDAKPYLIYVLINFDKCFLNVFVSMKLGLNRDPLSYSVVEDLCTKR